MSQINIMLTGVFLKLVGLAAMIATPVAWLLMNRWLQEYPYRISLGVVHFALALFLILAIASATVLFFSTKAARQNPADHLKYE